MRNDISFDLTALLFQMRTTPAEQDLLKLKESNYQKEKLQLIFKFQNFLTYQKKETINTVQ